eukprot:gnl/TRDRNA2_/TRDRNA2_156821_c0_seq2.p1 gnl/TRDRNA2_/TRDRNA2_156821_c0~~gnl/TRDRNA2_/TRDRNA2_156821_c0_seq2.p1  ORF type:complete len:269 (+),score=54.28 gnl/TRDRNA2_/TRDRNA2_156821_c0_seq2:331-1137(+)
MQLRVYGMDGIPEDVLVEKGLPVPAPTADAPAGTPPPAAAAAAAEVPVPAQNQQAMFMQVAGGLPPNTAYGIAPLPPAGGLPMMPGLPLVPGMPGVAVAGLPGILSIPSTMPGMTLPGLPVVPLSVVPMPMVSLPVLPGMPPLSSTAGFPGAPPPTAGLLLPPGVSAAPGVQGQGSDLDVLQRQLAEAQAQTAAATGAQAANAGAGPTPSANGGCAVDTVPEAMDGGVDDAPISAKRPLEGNAQDGGEDVSIEEKRARLDQYSLPRTS